MHWFRALDSTVTIHGPEQARTRGPNGRFLRGHSGNLSGRAGKRRSAAQHVKEAELFEAICQEFPDKLSALHLEYARLASKQLARASLSNDDALHVRLTNAAAKLIERIRSDLARRPAPTATAFDRYHAEKQASR
jgi:hypothetical protein